MRQAVSYKALKKNGKLYIKLNSDPKSGRGRLQEVVVY